ncbi:MAG: DUF4352 domain-containing protein [Raineya sp.]|jgi:hypothetical protein|nr:DUF4352 domain-containing protein [Raineya sp.]
MLKNAIQKLPGLYKFIGLTVENEKVKVNYIRLIIFIIVVAFIMSIIMGPKKESSSSSSKSDQPVVVKDEPAKPQIGQAIKTEYFEITVNKVGVMEAVNTGNEFVDLKPEKDNQYLVMNVTFKNIDNESRMMFAGKIIINYNGKDYTFDNPEPVLLEGWGLLMDQINPLTTKTTNLVYKIPKEIKGKVVWEPARSDVKIYIGDIQ